MKNSKFGMSLCALVLGATAVGCSSKDVISDSKVNPELLKVIRTDSAITVTEKTDTGASREITQYFSPDNKLICQTIKIKTPGLELDGSDGCVEVSYSGPELKSAPDRKIDYASFTKGNISYSRITREKMYAREPAVFHEIDSLFAKTAELFKPHLYSPPESD